MPARIIIISGFLGAGKTTLITELLKGALSQTKTVLIENDFGEASVDASLLKNSGFTVRELLSGCICCSLSGDFALALEEVVLEYHPEVVLIEPSGVGRLSDILKACASPRLRPHICVSAKITVVDARRCQTYRDNFGSFFEDQIGFADALVLSRWEEGSGCCREALSLLKGLNPHVPVYTDSWDAIPWDSLLSLKEPLVPNRTASRRYRVSVGEKAKGPVPVAQSFFHTVTLYLEKTFSKEEWKRRAAELEKALYGQVLRAKGIVPSPDGFLNLQYVPGEVELTPCPPQSGFICIIGRNLCIQDLEKLFNGD